MRTGSWSGLAWKTGATSTGSGGPWGEAGTCGRWLLRRAAAEARDGDRGEGLASLASLAEHDRQVGRVLRRIETADTLERLRLLAGD